MSHFSTGTTNLRAKIHAFALCPFRHPNTYHGTFDSAAVSLFIWGFLKRAQILQVAQKFPTFSKLTRNQDVGVRPIPCKGPPMIADVFM